jgi:hypothetical protein
MNYKTQTEIVYEKPKSYDDFHKLSIMEDNENHVIENCEKTAEKMFWGLMYTILIWILITSFIIWVIP